MNTSLKTQTIGIACGLAIGIASQTMAITVTTTNDPDTLVNNILGSGITVISKTYVGADKASGTFTGANGAIGIGAGIILTSGTAADDLGDLGDPGDDIRGAEGPNDNPNDTPAIEDDASTNNALPGDSDLDGLSLANTFDATILEFDFEIPSAGDLSFNYVFASEEYDDFVFAGFNDVFGFFLDGVNIALITGTTDPVSIDTVNGDPLNPNNVFYNSNSNQGPNEDEAPFDIEYDGFTDVFVAQALGLAAGTHTIKLAVSDASDRILDSAVFIEAGSFTVAPISTSTVPLPAAFWVGASMLGGLGLIRLRRQKQSS